MKKSAGKQLGVGKLFLNAARESGAVDISTQAYSLAFKTVLSIVPLLAVLLYIFKILGGLEYGYDRLEPFLLSLLSEGTGDTVAQHLKTFIEQVHAKTVGWVGIAGLVITAVMTYMNVASVFDKIWGHRSERKLYLQVLKALIVIAVGPPLAAISVALTTLITAQVKQFLPQGIEHMLSAGARFAAVFLNVLLFSTLYFVVPEKRIPWKTVLKGAILPAVVFEIAKSGYTIYTARFVSYSAFYGSLAAIPLFLLWIYIAWYITLFGALWIKQLDNRKGTKNAR